MHFDTITAAAARLRRSEISVVDLLEKQLERIDRLDPDLRSFSEVFHDRARRRAADLDREARHGEFRGPLHGIPISVKDLFWVEGTPPNAGGIVFRDRRAVANAAIVDRLEDAGAIIVGKVNMSEAALAAHHPDLPVPLNPWDPAAWIGASSSGSAAATAAGLGYASIATDTGGSIRFPSAAAGLTGLKPTWGTVSAENSVEFAASLDHIGPIGRSAADCSLLFEVLRDDDAVLDEPAREIRLGVDARYLAECDPETTAVLTRAIEVLTAAGASVVDVDLPPVQRMVEDWTPTCAVEAAVFHEPTFRAHPDEYGPQVRELLERGLSTGAVEYERMRRRRIDFRRDFARATRDVDVLILQVTGIAGPDASYMDDIGVGEEWRRKIMLATCPINFVGVPALTLPGGSTAAGRPIGFQLVGRAHGERTLLDLGDRFQAATDHHTRHPAGF